MMDVDLHNRELLLPWQFFTEEREGVHSVSGKPNSQNGSLCSGSSESGTEYMSSPVESEVGSTKSSEEEEGGEEDDYIAELTRKMAYYMFQDEDKQEKSWDWSGSSQSTLWSLLGSKRKSPNGRLMRETLQPVTPMIEDFEKMKINEEIPKYNPGKGLFSASIPIPLATRNPDIGFQSKKSLIDEQIRAIQFYKLKQEQAMKLMDQKGTIKQNYRSKERASSGFNNGQRVPSHPCAGCTLQPQQSGGLDDSNMRAVFLDTSGSKTGSGGTGVFLPRRIGASSETRKKQRCSTVLIPAKVVHALKLHFEKMGVPSRLNTGVPLQQDAHVGGRSSISSQQKHHPRTAPAISHQDLDLGLPQEWTY